MQPCFHIQCKTFLVLSVVLLILWIPLVNSFANRILDKKPSKYITYKTNTVQSNNNIKFNYSGISKAHKKERDIYKNKVTTRNDQISNGSMLSDKAKVRSKENRLSSENKVSVARKLFVLNNLKSVISASCLSFFADFLIKGKSRSANAATENLDADDLFRKLRGDDVESSLSAFGTVGNGKSVLVMPDWLFGRWEVNMCFVGYSLPMGKEVVPRSILRSLDFLDKQGSESSVKYEQRYYSTLPDSFENNMKVALGFMPESKIVPDRAFNTKSVIDAYYGYSAVQEVSYDIGKNPNKIYVDFNTVGKDFQSLPKRRQTIFINNIIGKTINTRNESNKDGDETREVSVTPNGNRNFREEEYISGEFTRTVTQTVRDISVSDSETISYFRLLTSGEVSGRQRVNIFLTPNPNSKEGEDFFKTKGKAVAVFDYAFTMKPLLGSALNERDENASSLVCTITPKNIEQCIGGGTSPSYQSVNSVGED